MIVNNSQDGAERLRQQIAKLQAKLKKKEAVSKSRERKGETRRKIMVGALALNHMEKNKDSAFAKTLHGLLDEYVTRPEDRALLSLPPQQPPANDSGTLKADFSKEKA